MIMDSFNDNEQLPEDFTPGPNDVVIGKGKRFYFHEGNAWLRNVIASMLTEYSKAVTKPEKSNIISEVVEHVRRSGKFVKKDINTGMWLYAEELLCREKCSQTFRDALHHTYRSSNVAKKNKRRREQQEKLLDEKRVQEAKRQRAARTAPAPDGIPSNLFELDFPSPGDGKPPSSGRWPRSNSDILTILAGAVSLSSIDNQDDNPFEPKPLPSAVPTMPAVPSMEEVVVANAFEPWPVAVPAPLQIQRQTSMSMFLKDDRQFDLRPLLGFDHSFTLKGEDSFDELSTISDLENLKAFNDESYDLGPNIAAAFAA